MHRRRCQRARCRSKSFCFSVGARRGCGCRSPRVALRIHARRTRSSKPSTSIASRSRAVPTTASSLFRPVARSPKPTVYAQLAIGYAADPLRTSNITTNEHRRSTPRRRTSSSPSVLDVSSSAAFELLLIHLTLGGDVPRRRGSRAGKPAQRTPTSTFGGNAALDGRSRPPARRSAIRASTRATSRGGAPTRDASRGRSAQRLHPDRCRLVDQLRRRRVRSLEAMLDGHRRVDDPRSGRCRSRSSPTSASTFGTTTRADQRSRGSTVRPDPGRPGHRRRDPAGRSARSCRCSRSEFRLMG